MLKVNTSFNFNNAVKNIERFIDSKQNTIIDKLKRVCRNQVKMAKSINPPIGYYDQTGDLSSSKGGMVFLDGVEVYNYFTLTDEGANGMKIGKKLAREIGSQTTGAALVIVAGMFYARYVESKNKDVISGTSDYLVDMLKAELGI